MGQQTDPIQAGARFMGLHILFISEVQRLAGYRELHPLDIILLSLGRILPADPKVCRNRFRLLPVQKKSADQDQDQQKFDQNRRLIFSKPHGCSRAFSLFYEKNLPV